jgi:sec-independent protein translocase protein TatC
MPPPAGHPDMHTMSFGDHLEELRTRLWWALAAPLPLFIVMFFFSDPLIKLLLRPVYDVLQAHDLPPQLQVLSPPEFLIAKVKLSLIAALVLSAPWLLWQGWKFIAPGLYGHERRFVHLLIPGSAVLTMAGIALLYFVMLPLMLHVLVLIAANIELEGVQPPSPAVQAILDSAPAVAVRTAPPPEPAHGDAWLLVPDNELHVAAANDEGVVEVAHVRPPTAGGVEQAFRVSSVLDFTLVLMLGVSIAFQMPLVIMLLGWIGLASPEWLRSRRRYALAVCGVVAAVITPADALSMVLMLIPLYALYELGILLLLLAPASAVAEGSLFGRRRGKAPPDKGSSQGEHADETAQKGAGAQPAETDPEATDEGADRGDGP